MTGQHLAKLKQWKAGMYPIDVQVSRDTWETAASALGSVRRTLLQSSVDVKKGFGEGAEVSLAASAAFKGAAERIEVQQTRMSKAQRELTKIDAVMAAALGVDNPEEPGPEPKQDDFPGLPIVADIQHAVEMAAYKAQAKAYADADEDARLKIEQITKTYNAAAEVFAEIHGDPYVPLEPDGSTAPGSPTGPGSPTVPTNPGYPHPPIVKPPIVEYPPPWPEIDNDPDIDDDIDDGPRDPVVQPPIVDPPIDYPPVSYPPYAPPELPPPGTGGGGGGGLNPGLIGGVAAAGVFGAPGVVKGIRGILAKGPLVRGGGTIGGTSRAGGPGALGRGPAGVAGSPVSRSAGGAGGGRGGGAAAAGTRSNAKGGRGTAGGRGAGAAAAGGRGGRKRDDKQVSERDLFDDGEDWLDDEGTAPGVLG